MLTDFRSWLQATLRAVLPRNPTAGAIGYALSNWSALTRYVESGILDIDNNACERAMRPVALGRKNWLFAGSDRGGRAAAIAFSLIQTCKLHKCPDAGFGQRGGPEHRFQGRRERTSGAW